MESLFYVNGGLMIHITKSDAYSVLKFNIEEFDFIKAPKITEQMNRILDEIQYSNIIVDLHNLNYIDSMGLSTLINISRKLIDTNNEMVVVCNTTKILQLFNIARVEFYFKIFPTIDAAEGYFKSDRKK